MKKKQIFIVSIIILFATIISITAISSKDRVWKGRTYFLEENTKIVFENDLKKDSNITIRLDTKMLKNTDVFLELHTPEKIIRWDKKFKETRENFNYEVKKDGKYTLLIIYTNKNKDTAEAEVEVNWKFN